MTDVFVSYKAEDRRRVRPLVDALEADGFSVWWDEQIGGGDEWRRSIEEHLDAAHCVIVVWSRRSTGSKGQFVRDEAMRAQRRGSYLPVTIDRIEPPLGFGERQAIDLVRWNGDRDDARFRAVAAAVRSICAGEPPLPFAVQRSMRVGRRTIVVGAGATLAAAAAGGWFLLRSRPTEASDSIAVLPFDNLSGDPAQAYFSDGMAEELRSALTRVPELKVVARTSSEIVRNDDARTAAQRLGVANILTGSVRRSANTIRISAQLIDGRTGLARWSEDFDQPLGDALSIQSSIAERVADALQIQLGETAKAVLTLGGTRNAAAHDHFLRANLGREDGSADGLRRAIGELDAAIEIDPNYVLAYAGKSGLLASYGANWARSASELALDLNEAVATARRAIALAPNLAQGHSALGYAFKLQLNFKDSFREMNQSASLPGAGAETFARYALLLAQIGRGSQASGMIARAISSDPLNSKVYGYQAIELFFSRRFAAAVAAARHSLEMNSAATFVRGFLGYSLIMTGSNREALAELAKMPSNSVQALTGKGVVAARMRDRTGVDQAVNQLRATFGDSVNYEQAEIYAQNGDVDLAIDFLKKPVSQKDPGFIFILVDPFLDPIRTDPRFNQIVRSLDFPS